MSEDRREVVNEMSSAAQLGGHTLQDWLNLEPVEGYRIELVDGHYRMTPAPAMPHNYVADSLTMLLRNAVRPVGLVAVTGINVKVGNRSYIPDLVVCASTDAICTPAEEILLAVEVVSPSTMKTDRLEKPAAYAAAGIPRYWRVELSEVGPPSIHCHELDDGVYRQVAVAGPGAPANVAVTEDVRVRLDVDAIFARRQFTR